MNLTTDEKSKPSWRNKAKLDKSKDKGIRALASINKFVQRNNKSEPLSQLNYCEKLNAKRYDFPKYKKLYRNQEKWYNIIIKCIYGGFLCVN